jgi:type VI secretion system (T6SS) effector TldE1-like protein
MSTSSVALAGRHRRKSSGKAISHALFGGTAVACLVIGCSWTVYSNIINASAYPTIGNADHVEAVVRRPKLAERSNVQVIHETFAAPAQQRPVVASITADMFNERFSAAHADAIASNAASAAPPEAPKLAQAPKTTEAAPAQLALNVPPPVAPAPRAETKPSKLRDMAQRAKNAVMSIASNDKQSITEKLWGKEPSHSLLSYASADASAITGSIGREQSPMMGGSPPYDRETAVYDITAHTVYLPDGTKLEAHSGLGDNMDDPRSQKIRMRGVTPPHIYTLKPRESLFHGVAALRLTPIGGEESIFGRDGLLAHSFMLGSSGASNGCVSFRDYNAFLNAYRNQGIRKLAVIARVE